MRGKIVLAVLVLSLSGLTVHAQSSTQPFPYDVTCSGVITTDDVPRQTYVISGEEGSHHVTFSSGQMVYINKGSDEGAKVGDEFSLLRPEYDTLRQEWTKWQFDILRRMGTLWVDQGRARIVETQPKTSIAVINHMCEMVQRGDVAVPYTAPPDLTLKPVGQFDRFAAPDGKAMAMIITGKHFKSQMGNNDIMFVNLGNAQGVHVGQYFRIFRYTGTQHEAAYQTGRFAFDLQYGKAPGYGFGAVPASWDWSNTPREVLGEGIVLKTGPNASTVLITFCTREVFPGDYVELE